MTPEPPRPSSLQAQGDSLETSASNHTVGVRDLLPRALEEVLGTGFAGAEAWGADPGSLSRELEKRFGRAVGRGLAYRVGAAVGEGLVPKLTQQLSEEDGGYRLLPMRSRLRLGLNGLLNLIRPSIGNVSVSGSAPDTLTWMVPDCSICEDQKDTQPICFFTLGLLRETLASLGAGQSFAVDEISCRARGDTACVFRMMLVPME